MIGKPHVLNALYALVDAAQIMTEQSESDYDQLSKSDAEKEMIVYLINSFAWGELLVLLAVYR